jgi:hypothetical protein
MMIAVAALAVSSFFGTLWLRRRSGSDPRRLKERFLKAGGLAGRARSDIIGVVGRPRRVSRAPFEGVLLEWSAADEARAYIVVLMFDADGRCLGVSHEHDGPL